MDLDGAQQQRGVDDDLGIPAVRSARTQDPSSSASSKPGQISLAV
jgi:hypothetical protein